MWCCLPLSLWGGAAFSLAFLGLVVLSCSILLGMALRLPLFLSDGAAFLIFPCGWCCFPCSTRLCHSVEFNLCDVIRFPFGGGKAPRPKGGRGRHHQPKERRRKAAPLKRKKGESSTACEERMKKAAPPKGRRGECSMKEHARTSQNFLDIVEKHIFFMKNDRKWHKEHEKWNDEILKKLNARRTFKVHLTPARKSLST